MIIHWILNYYIYICHHENILLELRKTENNGVTKFFIALTSDNMIKI